jgi:hypothetical protein
MQLAYNPGLFNPLSKKCEGKVKTFLAALMVLLLTAPVQAQWTKLPAPAIPKTADGKPNLSAPAPRAADGHPDLSGIWEQNGNRYTQNIAADLKPSDVPFQPWAKQLADSRADGSQSKGDPPANCLPQGVPRVNAAPPPWKIIQKPDLIVILYESHSVYRQIFLDGRELEDDYVPAWLGYSTGKWDGDTLVVETKGQNGKAWLDQMGKPATDAVHVTERFHRTDAGHMDLQITIDDPKAYTKPWTITEKVHLLTNTELMEDICNENNRDVNHLPGAALK